MVHLQGANKNDKRKGDGSSFASNDSSSSRGFTMELQTRGSSRSSISGDSVNSQIEVNEGDDLENRPKSKEIVDAPEGKTIPVTLSEAPLSPTKRRDMASKSLSNFFRRKKANITAEDNGIV
jgi:hypothetical protein